MKLTLLILAAGMGNRYGGIKQLEGIGPTAETIMDYSIYDAIKAGYNKVVFVIRKELKASFKQQVFPKYQGLIDIDYVLQDINSITSKYLFSKSRKKPWGTAHAILAAKDVIKEAFTVINADDFYGTDSFVTSSIFLKNLNTKTNNTIGLLAFKLKNTLSEFGSVSRALCQVDSNNFLVKLTEHTQIKLENDNIVSVHSNQPDEYLPGDTLVSMNMISFTPNVFSKLAYYFDIFYEKNKHSLTAEFFLPDFITKSIERDKLRVKVLNGDEKWFGFTYPKEKEWVMNCILKKIDMGNYPKTLFQYE